MLDIKYHNWDSDLFINAIIFFSSYNVLSTTYLARFQQTTKIYLIIEDFITKSTPTAFVGTDSFKDQRTPRTARLAIWSTGDSDPALQPGQGLPGEMKWSTMVNA